MIIKAGDEFDLPRVLTEVRVSHTGTISIIIKLAVLAITFT